MNRAANPGALDRITVRPLTLSRLGDIGLALVWGILAVGSLTATIANAATESRLTTAHHIASALILGLSAVLFMARGSAKARAGSWRSRVVAISGTWLMPVLILLPLTRTDDWLLTISTAGLVLLHIVVFWALLTLRRSFSIFPEARALIRTGPYAVVRHPLYGTYFAMYLFFLLPRLSPLSVAVTVLGIACEVWRSREEETILRAAFPDYGEYAATTPRFVPRITGRSEARM